MKRYLDNCIKLGILIALITEYGERVTCAQEGDSCTTPGKFYCATDQRCLNANWKCNGERDCPDGSDESIINCPGGHFPDNLTLWVSFGSVSMRFSLIYVDENVALYSTKHPHQNLLWLFRFLTQAWKYVKDNYGIIHNSPLLYVLLHDLRFGRRYYYNSRERYDEFQAGRNLFEFSLPIWPIPNHNWFRPIESSKYSPRAFETMFHDFGSIVMNGAKGISNNMDSVICGSSMRDIIFYDIYVHWKENRSADDDVLSWRSRNINSTSQRNVFCFRDWFLPIYENYGGVQVLNRFYDLSKSYYLRNSQTEYSKMNLEEYVHFWSESAGHNLQQLASTAFEWDHASDQQLLAARKSYVFDMNLSQSLAYADTHVKYYFKNYPIYSNVTYETISKAWTFVKDNYAPSKTKPQLHTIIFSNETLPSQKQCISMANNITSANQAKDLLYVIDCVASSNTNFYDSKTATAFVEQVIEEMVELTVSKSLSPDPESWPAFNVSGLAMTHILVYDIYNGLGMTKDATNWDNKVRKLDPTSKTDAFWFRDWYHTIYIKYGQTSVLKGFLSLVRNRTVKSQMNLGEFVHFWSVAANTNLRELAKLYHGWSDEHQIEFVQARVVLPSEYICTNCDELPPRPDEPVIESTTNYPVEKSTGFLEENLTTIAIGATAVGVALLMLIVGIKMFMYRRKIQILNQKIRNLTNEEVDEFYQGNPNLVGSSDSNEPVQSRPFNTDYEISQERLIIDDKKILGSGEFGLVKQGLLKGDPNSGTEDMTVAVKTVKPHVDVTYFLAFLTEIKIMAHLEKHENIASLLGTVTRNIQNRAVFVVMEFCAQGDLLHYLKANGKNFVDLFSTGKVTGNQNLSCLYINAPDASVKIEPSCGRASGSGTSQKAFSFSTLTLIQWSGQIAKGMDYLNNKNVVHGDLAARNVLLDDNNVAKISDFGLSRQLVNYSNYLKKSKTPVPWRWLAIESLENMVFSPQSDIWAFGVTLWEIFTLGKIPYPAKSWNDEFIDGLVTGLRLASPQFGNQEIYNLMLNCVKTVPTERISFSEIIAQLETIEASLSIE